MMSDYGNIHIWKEQEIRNHPFNIIGRDRFGGAGVLVWGGIILCSRRDLHVFQGGAVTGASYCADILVSRASV